MKRIIALLLAGFAWQMALCQYSSGTATTTNCYTGSVFPNRAVLKGLHDVVFSAPKIQGNFTLDSACYNVVIDHPTGSDYVDPVTGAVTALCITNYGSHNTFQFGKGLVSSGESIIRIYGSYSAVNYCDTPGAAGRLVELGGTNNLALGCSATNACQKSLYGLDDAPFYTANNNLGTNGWNRFIGCTSKGSLTTWSFYGDNHTANTTFQGCTGDKPVLINGGSYDIVRSCVVPGVTVLDRQWDVNIILSARYVIGDQILSSGPVTTSPTLYQWGNTTPRRQFVTVK